MLDKALRKIKTQKLLSPIPNLKANTRPCAVFTLQGLLMQLQMPCRYACAPVRPLCPSVPPSLPSSPASTLLLSYMLADTRTHRNPVHIYALVTHLTESALLSMFSVNSLWSRQHLGLPTPVHGSVSLF